MNLRQERFCYYYIETGNGTQSAIKAGYAKKTAKNQASRLLTNVNIMTKIEKIRNKVSDDMSVDLYKVVDQLMNIAFSSMDSILYIEDGGFTLRNNGSFIGISKSKFIKTDKKVYMRLEMEDRVKALRELARILGYYK